MKKVEIVEVGIVTVGLLLGGAGLVYAGIKQGMKQGHEVGHKEGFDKGAVAQYKHMVKDVKKKAIGFGPHKIEEEGEADE